MDNKFYIFLDFDGVFNYYSYVTEMQKQNKYDELALYVCPDNIRVFNKILNEIKSYGLAPKIVISSNRKYNEYNEVTNKLIESGIDYKGSFDRTQPTSIGEKKPKLEIGRYLTLHNIENNYVIIDDILEDLRRYVPKENLLETSGLSGTGLNEKNFETFKENLKKLVPTLDLSNEK